MTVIIDLAPEQEARLRRKAEARGQALEEFAADSLRHIADERTLAESLEGLIGVVSSDGSMDARDSEEVFGEYLAEKHRAGRL